MGEKRHSGGKYEKKLRNSRVTGVLHNFILNFEIHKNILNLKRKRYFCAMRIFTEQRLKEYIAERPETKTALQEWASIVKRSEWKCFADVKATFNTVDNVGNQHYVFNILGNRFRLVVVIKFTIKFVYIRFIGTHEEYDKIDCRNI